jgi:hypothetical protein
MIVSSQWSVVSGQLFVVNCHRLVISSLVVVVNGGWFSRSIQLATDH